MARSNFRYKVGESYRTQTGQLVRVVGRTKLKGYECLICNDGRHRYDRSIHHCDAGRCTGTNFDYSYPHNFARVE